MVEETQGVQHVVGAGELVGQLLKLGLMIKIGGGQWNLKIHFRDGKYNIVIG